MKRIFTVCICLVLSIAGHVLTAGDIPLKQAVEKGLRLDAQYKNRVLDGNISANELEKAKDARWFNLDFNASYLLKSERMEIVTPAFSKEAGAIHNYDLNLGLVQPIFTGYRLSNRIKLEEQRNGSKKYDTLLRKLQVEGMIKASYFNYHLLKSKKKSLELLIETLKLHKNRLNDLYKEEQVRRSDLLETEIKLTDAQMDVETLLNAMEEETIRFARLTGYKIGDIREDYQETAGTFPESLEHFVARHPALKTLDSGIRQMQLQKKIVSGAYLPQVNSFAEFHYGRPGIDFFKNQWMGYFQGGISVSMKLFDWNKKKKDIYKLDTGIRQLKNNREELVVEAEKDLKKLYANLRSIEKQLSLAKQLAKSAAEDAALKEDLYKENQSANIDYLAALLDKERYESMQQELSIKSQLLKLNINVLIGKED